MKKMVIPKKTDAELFKELRINILIIGLAMITIFIVTFFIESLGDTLYRAALLLGGLLLISYSFQKYLQENLKVRTIVMWVLLGLAILGVIVFLFVYIK